MNSILKFEHVCIFLWYKLSTMNNGALSFISNYLWNKLSDSNLLICDKKRLDFIWKNNKKTFSVIDHIFIYIQKLLVAF